MATPNRSKVNLPNELIAEVAEYLFHPSDRATLFSLSLVNAAWREESQRVLFRDLWVTMEPEGAYYHWTKRDPIYTHIPFLRSICTHPRRLGPYVRSYAQFHLASDSDPHDPHSLAPLLWKLTLKALPALINLKHLCFRPVRVDFPDAANAALSRCKFQLKTLFWGLKGTPKSFSAFLSTQNSLVNLDLSVGDWQDHLSKLPEDACPHLISVACGLSAFPYVATNRNIKGWKMQEIYPAADSPSFGLDLTTATRIKYLSVWDYEPYIAFVGLVLLQIELWCSETIENLGDLPELRTLVLYCGYAAPDITNDESARLGIVAAACKGCPKLDRILHTLSSAIPHKEHYSEILITRSPIGNSNVPQVVIRDVYRDVVCGAPWWDIYAAA